MISFLDEIIKKILSIENVKGVWIRVEGEIRRKVLLALEQGLEPKLNGIIAFIKGCFKGEQRIFLGCKLEHDFFYVYIWDENNYVIVWAGSGIDIALLKLELDVIMAEVLEKNKGKNSGFFNKFRFW